jgi:hypothetical protein
MYLVLMVHAVLTSPGHGGSLEHDCIPRVSLPVGQAVRFLPNLHYLSASTNQLVTQYKIDVSIEVEGCGSANKFHVRYFQASSSWGKVIGGGGGGLDGRNPLGASDDARNSATLAFPDLGRYELAVELVSAGGFEEIVSVTTVSLELVRTEKRRTFCYLIQTAAPIDVSHLKTGDSEVLQLVWQERVNESEGIVFFPNCSWAQGRNRLFEEMLRRYADTEFEYAVFMDDDVELEELLDYGINTGNAWRTFERYLTHWRPAVGLPSYQGRRASASPRFDSEVQTVYNFDQIVVAYHWETWPGTQFTRFTVQKYKY